MADVLAARDAGRLTSFARAFKAAARAVVLYPDGHPAIASTLGRLAQLTGTSELATPLRLAVTADTLLLDGAAAPKADPSIAELATLLHSHLVGALTIQPGTGIDSWRHLLRLLGRTPEDVRDHGGIARLWGAWPQSALIEIREIDYAEVLRERDSGLPVSWQHVVAQCLVGDAPLELPPDLVESLLEAADRNETFRRMLTSLSAAVADAGGNVDAQAAAIVRLLRAVMEAVNQRSPEDAGAVIRDLAIAVGRLTPDLLLSLARRRSDAGSDAGDATMDMVLGAIPDGTIASFVAEHAVAGGAALDRVAQAFQALVVDRDRRERLVAMAHDTAIVSGAEGEAFEQSWQGIAERLLSQYSDEPFVSGQYARELATVRAHAVQVEDAHDDPPDRIAGWLASVSTSELRHLDVLLVTDLLDLEQDLERRAALMEPVVSLVDDLLLVGDFDAAANVVSRLAADIGAEAADERQALARATLDRLVTPATLQHLLSHLATLEDTAFARVRALCVAIGERLVAPLAEAVTREERPRTRERLTALLIAFGAAGRREADQLRTSASADVRRAAIYLLREFGGVDALPHLTDLMRDPDGAVQRDAVRALLAIGSPRAIEIVQQSIAAGPDATREAIMQALGSSRDDRATPLLVHIVEQVSHRGEQAWMYTRALEILGQLRDPRAVPSLRAALYRGEWWAPRRTAALRRVAAAALARTGAPEAEEVLREAVDRGPRGVRAAAAAELARVSDGATGEDQHS
jgi:hypothetical protein